MVEDNSRFEGGCACGNVRYRVNAPPMFVHCCHCRFCQRETGSAFVVNALVEGSKVEIRAGEPTPCRLPTESGNPHIVYRCPECHIALWSEYSNGEKLRFIRVGTLDEPDRFPPDIHIFTSSKVPWTPIPNGALSVPEYYDMRQIWPPEQFERLLAAVRPGHE
ncbi:MAG: GFA family protein [Alphaproteobacteria bacterium]|nr:GFA family protein [Alphaproteobacteria bacterium]